MSNCSGVPANLAFMQPMEASSLLSLISSTAQDLLFHQKILFLLSLQYKALFKSQPENNGTSKQQRISLTTFSIARFLQFYSLLV